MAQRKKLPKYWVVKNDGSQLYKDTVIEYLNKMHKGKWGGNLNYYGFDGSSSYGGTDGWKNIRQFKNNPTLLTLKEFINLTQNKENMATAKKAATKVLQVSIESRQTTIKFNDDRIGELSLDLDSDGNVEDTYENTKGSFNPVIGAICYDGWNGIFGLSEEELSHLTLAVKAIHSSYKKAFPLKK